jgi:predicted amidohydrolase YtcJ
MNQQDLSLIIYNVTLWTGTTATLSAADAIGICGDTIIIIADSATVLRSKKPDTHLIDGKRGLLLPGFTDSHCHFLDGGLRLLSLRLRDVKTREEFTARVAAATHNAPRGSWILGGDWDHHSWGGTLPEKSWIDAVSPDHPVWLNRMDGHMALANSRALQIADITSMTVAMLACEGGEILCDKRGEPTGLLKDNAQNLVISHIPPRSAEENQRALEAAMSYVAAHGVTAVHSMVTVDCACGLWPKNKGRNAEEEDMTAAFSELEVYRNAHHRGALRTRIHAALPLAAWQRLRDEIHHHGRGDDWLRIGGLKAMIDGSLGARTAAMLADYSDIPQIPDTHQRRGYLIWDTDILEILVHKASAAGLQVMVHAIGDLGVRTQLDIFERVTDKLLRVSDKLRFRIEHAQHIAPEDIPRFGQLGVIASLQMSHLADDGRWATAVLGEKRLATSWPMKSLRDSGARVALGSDWFVTEPSPLQGIYAAVTRRTMDAAHPEGLVPQERVSVEDALRGYTVDAAYAGFEEQRRGTLEVGKLADLVLLERDIRAIAVEDIPSTKILLTLVGGKIVHQILPRTYPTIASVARQGE